MGINYEEPYCQGISFFELPIELDPNAIEYLPLNMPKTFAEELPMKSNENLFDKSVPNQSDENFDVFGLTVDDVQLLNGLWLPELNGYSFNNPMPLEISEDFSNLNENSDNFPYNSLPYTSQYISSNQNFNGEVSDDQIFLDPQNVRDYPANFPSNGDQTEPHERLDMYPVPSESSGFTNQNLWVTYNGGCPQNSQAFPDQAAFYKETAFCETPESTFFQNSPYQTCINGNFNTVNVPNNYIPNNYAPNNYIANNYVANSFVPNNFVSNNYVPNNYVPNNYAPTNYVQVNNSQAYEVPDPMEKFTLKNPNNFGLTNMNTQVYPSYKGETQVCPKITRNSPLKSSRKTFSSRMQSNKGYNAVPNNPKEQSFRFNNQYATEFHSNIKDKYARPSYVRDFSKFSEDYANRNQLATKFQDRPPVRKNREANSVKSGEHNQSNHNSKSSIKSHPYKKDKDSNSLKDGQLKENVSFQRPNSREATFLTKGQQEQTKPNQPGTLCPQNLP